MKTFTECLAKRHWMKRNWKYITTKVFTMKYSLSRRSRSKYILNLRTSTVLQATRIIFCYLSYKTIIMIIRTSNLPGLWKIIIKRAINVSRYMYTYPPYLYLVSSITCSTFESRKVQLDLLLVFFKHDTDSTTLNK